MQNASEWMDCEEDNKINYTLESSKQKVSGVKERDSEREKQTFMFVVFLVNFRFTSEHLL